MTKIKHLIFVFLSITSTCSASVFEKIDCEEHNPLLTPYKTEFKGNVSKKTLDISLKEFFNKREQAYPDTPAIHRRWILEVVDRSTGKFSKTLPVRSYQQETDEVVIEKHIIQPSWIVTLGGNIFIGTNFGEFGGELLKIDERNHITLLDNMNVEDIYQMPFGVVVTSGLAHMSSNEGRVSLINPNDKIEPLYGLIGKPQSSWLLSNGDLLINSYPSGSQVLTKQGHLKRVECIANIRRKPN